MEALKGLIILFVIIALPTACSVQCNKKVCDNSSENHGYSIHKWTWLDGCMVSDSGKHYISTDKLRDFQ